MPTSTITTKGQVTIPKKIRESLGLQPGDVLNFSVESDDLITIRLEKGKTEKAYGILERKSQEVFSVEEMDSGVAEYFKKKYRSES